MNQRIGQYREVRPVEGGAQVTVGGGLAGAVDGGEIPPAGAFLVGAVEVVAVVVSEPLGGLEVGVCEGVDVAGRRGPHGAVGAPVSGVAPLGRLGALEERQKVFIAPAGGACGGPLVV